VKCQGHCFNQARARYLLDALRCPLQIAQSHLHLVLALRHRDVVMFQLSPFALQLGNLNGLHICNYGNGYRDTYEDARMKFFRIEFVKPKNLNSRERH
jgi:hypothetical protein